MYLEASDIEATSNWILRLSVVVIFFSFLLCIKIKNKKVVNKTNNIRLFSSRISVTAVTVRISVT